MTIGRYLNAYLLYPLAEYVQRRDIRSKAALLRQETAEPFPVRRRRRLHRLVQVLRQAATSVPYYRDLFHKVRFDPEKVATDPAYLRDLPFLTKQIIREQPDRLLAEKADRAALHVRKTGGSTGPAALIYYSQEALDWTAAVNLLALESAGKRRHTREVHLSSKFPGPFPWKDRLKEWIKCAALNRVNVYTSSFDDTGLDLLWRQLRAARCYLVQGHPSTLYALAVHSERRGYDAAQVFQVFESTGEAIEEKKRQLIETVFGCQVINRYGSAEFGLVAYQTIRDPCHWLKVQDCSVWPETSANDWGHSELVLTGLLNDAMPLLRYRTGDLGEVVEEPDGFYLKNLAGRVHDLVRIADKTYPTHYVQDLLDRIGGVDEFQFEQREGLPLLLRLVVTNSELRQAVEGQLRNLWGNGICVEFVDFNGLKRQGRHGKFRYVVESSQAA